MRTTPNTSKLRHLQKLLKSQEHAEELAMKQASVERASRLLAEPNELKRAEYQRRYQLGQQKKADANERDLTLQLENVTTENDTLQETIARLRNELARVQDEFTRLKDERDTLRQENERVTAIIQTVQPQADALARIKSDVQTELGCLLNTDEKVLSVLSRKYVHIVAGLWQRSNLR